jgi:membrane-bound lytic murein transglycosylase B
MLKQALFILCLTGSTTVMASDYLERPEFLSMAKELEQAGTYAPGELQTLFKDVKRQDRVLELMSRAPERRKEWFEYRPIFITSARIRQGVQFWRENAEALALAESKTGVPAEMIVSILGVETSYGRNKGSFRVIDALATLGFDHPPRAPFFSKELREFLILSRENDMDPSEIRGSYAGAMGYPQFMPSSWRNLAVDFDGDGRIDLINNPVDAIGSIANYFKGNGWKPSEAVVLAGTATGEISEDSVSTTLNTSTTLAAIQQSGIQNSHNLAPTTAATAFRLQGTNGSEYWIGLHNFYVITRYNRSIMYAMAVNDLANLIKQEKQAEDNQAN